MDSHASKRRKTSPRTSIPIPSTNDNHATDGTVPPPPNGNDAPSSQSPRKRRPDFASPTKASLSRHNPEILARRRQSAREASQAQQQQKPSRGNTATIQRQTETTRPPDQPASTPGSPESDISLSELLTAQLEEEVVVGKVAAGAARPRRSPTKPVLFTRPLPPPAPEGEEELVDPFKRRPRIRRSDVAEEPVEEPELPPTPSQLGIADPTVTTPPRGIHSSSSPTKRRLANRDRRIRAIPMKKSPLKKQFVPSPVQEREEVEGEDNEAIDALANPQRAEKGKEVEVETHPARGVPSDEEIRGMEEYLETLRTEEENLWSDLQMISGLGKEWAMQAQAAKLIPFIKKHPKLIRLPELPDATSSVQDEIDALLRGAMNPSALLPFSKPTTELTTTTSKTTSNTGEKSLPTSHLPVSMTAQEELPYLQIFSPLAFTSHNTPLTTADMESNIQRHDISIRALDAPHLFSARLAMIVDLSDFSITDLKVPRLDPNAQRELGPFIEDVLTRTDRAIARNVSLITWAMGEWYRLAVKRAQFWRSLAREFEDAKRLDAHAEKIWKNRARQYNREVGETIDDEMAKEDEGLSAGDVGGDMGRAAMMVGLGRWGEEELMVRVGWRIGFDWTGDARSKVSVAVGMPGRWHRGDRNGVLAKVPQIFDDYVRGTSDVMAAVRRVVALVGYDADAPEARDVVAA